MYLGSGGSLKIFGSSCGVRISICCAPKTALHELKNTLPALLPEGCLPCAKVGLMRGLRLSAFLLHIVSMVAVAFTAAAGHAALAKPVFIGRRLFHFQRRFGIFMAGTRAALANACRGFRGCRH